MLIVSIRNIRVHFLYLKIKNTISIIFKHNYVQFKHNINITMNITEMKEII